MVAIFFVPVQTGPGVHPASYTVGTGSFSGVKRPGRGVDHPRYLAPSLKKEYNYTSSAPKEDSMIGTVVSFFQISFYVTVRCPIFLTHSTEDMLITHADELPCRQTDLDFLRHLNFSCDGLSYLGAAFRQTFRLSVFSDSNSKCLWKAPLFRVQLESFPNGSA